MKLHTNTIQNAGIRGLGRLLFAGAAGLILLLSGCTRDDLAEGYGNGNGEWRHAKLSLDLGVPAPAVVTRAGLDTDQKTKIESLWIGVFDTQTGEQVGRLAGHIRKASDGSRYTFDSGSSNYTTINGLDIYFYDSNPEVYIVAVANYTDVKAKYVGETYDGELPTLAELLGIDPSTDQPDVREASFTRKITWDEFRSIAVDTESVTATRDNDQDKTSDYPFLMGFFTTSYKGSHTTVNPDGSMPEEAHVPLAQNGASFAANIDLKGAVHLYRLVSEFQVQVVAAEPTDGYQVTVKDVKYRVVNTPLEVYLAERPTYVKGATAGKGTYRTNTPNSADVAVIDGTSDGYGTFPQNGEFMDADGSPEEGYSFSFQQYENKHWAVSYDYEHQVFRTPMWPWSPEEMEKEMEMIGPASRILQVYGYPDAPGFETFTWEQYLSYLAGANFSVVRQSYWTIGPREPWYYMNLIAERNAHSIREAKWHDEESEETLFKSLVSDPEKPFNNNASYIEIEADVTVEGIGHNKSQPAQHAVVRYLIHEGYTTKSDGTAAERDPLKITSLTPISDRMLDFQCTRNTLYNYTIRINGFDDLTMQAEGNSSHNDGLKGTVQKTVLYEASPWGAVREPDGFIDMEQVLKLKFENRSKLKWRFYERRPDGNGGTVETNYGTWKPEDTENFAYDWPEGNGTVLPRESCKFYNDMQISVWRYIDNKTSSDPNEAGYYLYQQLAGPMTIDEFIDCEPQESWYNPDWSPRYAKLYFAIRLPAYEVDEPGNRDYEHYDDYRRGFYLYLDTEDDGDGCQLQCVYGIEQNVYDDRPYYDPHDERNNWVFIYNHNWTNRSYDNYNHSFPYNYSSAELKSGDYGDSFWSTVLPGKGVVSDDRIEMVEQHINANGRYYFIHNYAVEVEGYDPVYFTVSEDAYEDLNENGSFSSYRVYPGYPTYLYNDNNTDAFTFPYHKRYNFYYDFSYEDDYRWVYDYVVSYPIMELIQKLGLSAGEYRARIYPVPQKDYANYKPFKPDESWWRPLIIKEPEWNFSQDMNIKETIQLYTVRNPSYLRDYISYGGLTIVGGSSGSGDFERGVQLNSGGYVNLVGMGYFNRNYRNRTSGYYESDRYDFRAITLMVNRHGTLEVTASGNGELVFAARNLDITYDGSWVNSVSQEISGRQTVRFNTRDVIDYFEDNHFPRAAVFSEGEFTPVELGIYGSNAGFNIYDIKWVESDDQMQQYNGQIYYSNFAGPRESYGRYDLYNFIYYRDNYYIVPGFETKFAFEMSKVLRPEGYDPTGAQPHFDQFKISLYRTDDHERPIYTSEPIACELRSFQPFPPTPTGKEYGRGYYNCPLYIPSGRLPADVDVVDIAITPISDEYLEAPVFLRSNNKRLSIRVVDEPQWWGTFQYMDGYWHARFASQPTNPFYIPDMAQYYDPDYGDWVDESFAEYKFVVTDPNEAWEHQGLTFHGGELGGTNQNGQPGIVIGSDSFTFQGNGYPAQNNSTPASGRYFSFTVDHPGSIVISAQATGATGRYFRLYSGDGQQQLAQTEQLSNSSRMNYTLNVTPEMLSGGLTEFILCPVGGINVYSITWEQIDYQTRLEWSDKVDAFVDTRHAYNERYKDESSSSAYQAHLAMRHFGIGYAFSEYNSTVGTSVETFASSYRIEFKCDNPNKPDLIAPWDFVVADYPYQSWKNDDDTRSIAFKFIPGNTEGNMYHVLVTPTYDSYTMASAQELKPILYVDWNDRYFYDDATDDCYNFYYWGARDFNPSGARNVQLSANQAVEFAGMTLNGSGATMSMNDGYITINGAGYPANTAVGVGRNLSFSVDIPGEFWVVARPGNPTYPPENYGWGLYPVPTLENQKPNPFATDHCKWAAETSLANMRMPMVLKLDEENMYKNVDSSGNPHYSFNGFLCPDNSTTLFGIFFVPKDSPLYDYWSEHGEEDTMLQTMLSMDAQVKERN